MGAGDRATERAQRKRFANPTYCEASTLKMKWSRICRHAEVIAAENRLHFPRPIQFACSIFIVAIGLCTYALNANAQSAASRIDSTLERSRQALMAWTNGAYIGVRPSGPKPTFDANLRLLGEAWYGELCTPCHGPRGDGNGIRARQLLPRPRDFTKGVYEFRSTSSGALPTDEDIWKVVSGGVHGTAMVPWITLPEYDRWSLVAYVETFSPRFAIEARRDALKPAAPPAETPTLAATGQQLFSDAGCIECHGAKGMGDGPSASTLTDAGGLPIRPIDFASGIFRRGSRMEDIFLTVRTGLDGTPMPSYADSLTADQTWALAAYVRSLITRRGSYETATSSAMASEAQRQERLGMMIDMPAMGRIPMSRDLRPPRR